VKIPRGYRIPRCRCRTGPVHSAIEKIKRDFYIVHIYGNNLGGRTLFNFPAAPEMTFLIKRFFCRLRRRPA
jgi:hypothetical protein